MPTYGYSCTSCSHNFDTFQSMNDKPIKKCPHCKKNTLKREIGTGGGIIFKGTGFHATDYRKPKGFTLVEAMIVLVIVGLLAAMAIPAFMKVRQGALVRAYEKGEKLNLEQMKIVREYYADKKSSSERKTIIVSETTSSPSSPILIPADEISEVTVNGQKFYVWAKK